VAASKRAPLAERKQMKKDEAAEREEVGAEEDQPPAKKKKLDQVTIMGDKQKVHRTVALGSLSAGNVEYGLELAASAGKVRHRRSMRSRRASHIARNEF
jgi:hypothetical protein